MLRNETLEYKIWERPSSWDPGECRARNPPLCVGKFSGFRRTFQGRQEFLVVRLTRGGRGTGMGGGPRWRRCCTGRGVFCCGRRRWWVCRVSTDLACLLQHLVYGVHVCPHGIKRHNAKAHQTNYSWFSNRALNFLTLICLLLPFLFFFFVWRW